MRARRDATVPGESDFERFGFEERKSYRPFENLRGGQSGPRYFNSLAGQTRLDLWRLCASYLARSAGAVEVGG